MCMSLATYYYKIYFYFNRLPRLAHYSVTSLTLGCIAASWWFFCYRPIKASIRSYTNKITYLNRQKKNYPPAQGEYTLLKRTLDNDEHAYSVKDALAWIIDCAQANSLLLSSCIIKGVHAKADYTSSSFIFSLRGSFKDILAFFKCIERCSYCVSCVSSSLKRINDTFLQCTLEIELFELQPKSTLKNTVKA
jgi:hypothetical protein